MTSVLAVDVGNTNVVLGVYENAKLLRTWRLATVHDRTEDELAVSIDALLDQQDLALAELDALVVGSVVPPLTQAFTRLAERYLERPAFVIGPGIKTGVRLRVDNPSEVGADRIANTLAAHRRYGGPVVIVDFGTTTNFDVVNADGDFLGGAFAPGLEVSAEALFRPRVAALPRRAHAARDGDREEHRRLPALGDRLWLRRARRRSAYADPRRAAGEAARDRDRRPRVHHRAARQGHRERRRRSHARRPAPPLGAERVSAALDGRFVVLAVTGSIAVYKMVELARRLVQAGATVQVVMSRSATEFVRPLTFQALTYRPVEVEMFQIQDERAAGHVAMGRQADVVVIAPATAHVIARLAAGFSDDLIATTVLATAAPIVVAPAMETHMWQNAATQANVATLRARGMRIVEPDSGPLASGEVGPGRLAALERIEAAIAEALTAGARARRGGIRAPSAPGRGSLAGRKVVVTAGPTLEAIDPVRFVSNRSSGKMGYAIAKAAHDAGADVTLVSGPTALATPTGVRMIVVESAQDMKESVLALLPETDAVVMAAAVADYRPTETSTRKIKKRDAGSELTIRLTENPDVLKAVVAARKRGTIVICAGK